MSQLALVGSHLILPRSHLDEMKICHMNMCRWASTARWDRFFFKEYAHDFKMATTSTTRKSSKKYSFKWTPEMAKNLIESIRSFKASMTFKNLDFDANKAAQYSAVRETMAAFIVMMKLYLAQLRPPIGLRTLVNCHMKIGLQ